MRDGSRTVIIVLLILLVLYLLYRYYFGGQIPFSSGQGFSLPDLGGALGDLFGQIGQSLNGR